MYHILQQAGLMKDQMKSYERPDVNLGNGKL